MIINHKSICSKNSGNTKSNQEEELPYFSEIKAEVEAPKPLPEEASFNPFEMRKLLKEKAIDEVK